MTKPNLNVIRRWVKALRGGKYKQDKSQLKTETGYCCLGVLCDLHAKEVGKEWDSYFYCGSDAELPAEVSIWSGLMSANPRVAGKSLAVLNDGFECKPHSFSQIADLIEAEYLNPKPQAANQQTQ